MAGRARLLVALVGLCGAIALIVVIPAVQNRLTYGTFSTQGPPPRVDYCGRRYYPGSDYPNSRTVSGNAVAAELAANGLRGLTRVGTAPSGMPIVANLLTPGDQAHFHTNICTMEVWVQTGWDSYLGYGLSGGP